jgi:hypothetical protein
VDGAGTDLLIGGEGQNLMLGGFRFDHKGKDHAEGAGPALTQALDQIFSRADLDLTDLLDKTE